MRLTATQREHVLQVTRQILAWMLTRGYLARVPMMRGVVVMSICMWKPHRLIRSCPRYDAISRLKTAWIYTFTFGRIGWEA
jgi:hypothetical protein